MKHFFGLLMVATLMTGTLNAQHLNFGIKGGVNFYNNENNDNINYDMKPGFHLGVLWHIHITDHFAIQPEAVYSQQGTKYNFGSDENKLKLNYVNLPVLFQYMFDNGFRLEAGPQLGVLATANAETNGNNVEVKNSFEDTDISIAVGVSYVKPSTGFGIDVRYNHGLTDISKNNTIDTRNNGIQLGVFYLFGHRN